MLTGLLGGLLASSLVVNCTLINFDPQPTLACSDRRELLLVSYSEWPEEWHGPEMGFTYSLVDGKPVRSIPDELAQEESVRRAREQQLRWMRRPAQRNRAGKD